MKKISVILIAFFLVISLYAQTDATYKPTTEIEYTYIIKGIPNSIENALDVKRGYSIDGLDNFSAFDFYDHKFEKYSFRFANLIRDDKSLSAIIVKGYSEYTKKTYWFCIPHGDFQLNQKFEAQLDLMDKSFMKAFILSMLENYQNDIIYSFINKPKSQFSLTDCTGYTSKEQIFTIVEKQPEFIGGQTALFDWISTNIKYPESARSKHVEGTAYLGFVIEKNGCITNVEVKRGIGFGCDEEAVRLIKSMPQWNAGTQNGQAIRVAYTLPIKFKL